MKTINLAVALDACDFPDNVEDEMTDKEISTHYQNGSFRLNWNEKNEDCDMPMTKKWLIDTYGEDIKKYTIFAISAT